MGGLLQVLAVAALGGVANNVGRIGRSIVSGLVAAAFFAAAAAFVVAAGYEALAREYGTLPAKLIVAAVFLVLGLTVLAVSAARRARARRRAALSVGGPATAASAFMMGFVSGLSRRRR